MATFSEFVIWLASAAALGVVSSVLVQLIKAVFLAVQDTKAKIVSVLAACALSILAQLAVPFLPEVPAWVDQLFPTIAWLWSQIVWEIILKPMEL